MKQAEVSFHKTFPRTPVTGWVDAQYQGWINPTRPGGQRMASKYVQTPFRRQRQLWARLEVHFNGVDLRFATPQELDHFLSVLETTPLPSGESLVRGQKVGRPNRHWLSRLPGKAKSLKFRAPLCKYLRSAPEAAAFRKFYESTPVQYSFPGYFKDRSEADAWADDILNTAKADKKHLT